MRDTLAVDQPVARVDHGRLADGDIFHLCFGDLQLGLQVTGAGHFAQRRAGRDLLPFFHGRERRGELLAACRRTRPAPSICSTWLFLGCIAARSCSTLTLLRCQLGLFGLAC